MNWLYVMLVAECISCNPSLAAPGVLTNLDFGIVRDAIQGGGSVVIATDGAVNVSATLDITKSVTVDAAGHAVVFGVVIGVGPE
jgi:hypothetical protein